MDKPFPAYRGDEPYIFVSYSHDDEAEVGTEIRWLQNRGVNVWFDEGIVPGHEWTESLGAAISGCSTFLYFITPRSVSSEYCRRELGLAIEKSLKIMAVYLEPTDLPVGLQLSLGNRQGIFKLALSESDYQKQLYDALPIDVIADDAKPFDVARHETTGKHHIQNDQRRGILVLPFTNRSRDEDTKYICGGIADEITTALSAVEPLRVIARGSAMQIASENRNLKSIGQQLDVQYVLQGSVQKIGEKLRITAQLPSTQSTEILWADKWTSNVDQIFEIQEVIARGVVDALEIQLNASQNARLSERPIPNIHAYEYYLRARSLIYQYTADALDQALTYLDLGAEIIGANAHFISAIGYVHWQFHNAGIDLDPRHKEEAYKCAHELFALNPHSSAGHRLIGLLMFREKGAMSESIQHLNTSLQADPNDTDALLWLPLLYGFVGRISSGQALAERLISIDPLTTLPLVLPGFLDMLDGDLERGCKRLLNSHEMNPENPITTFVYGQVLAMSSRNDEAEKVFVSLDEFVPDSFFSQLGKFYIHALHHDRDAALEVANDELRQEAETDLQYSWSMAQCYALINELDDSIQWLENAMEYGFWNYPLFSERDPLLAPIREHERFPALMDDLKQKWVNFEG